MKTRFLLPLLCMLGLSLSIVAVPSTAHATTKLWAYQASAGATYIKLADGTVSSDLTAASTITGGPNGASRSNSTAAVSVAGGAVKTGAVQTKTTATKTATTTTLHSWARTASVNLLSGLVKIDAITTNLTSTATTSGTTSYSGNTQFAGIHIAGIRLPLTIPKNYSATIPGVADVRLNYVKHGATADASATFGWALSLTLIKAQKGVPAGATIILNPETHFFNEATPSPGATLYGMAFGTQVAASGGSLAKIESGPTAFLGTPYKGSNGKTLSRTTATVNVPGLLTTGAVTSTSTSTKDLIGDADIRNTNTVAGLNLLGGLVKATAIKVVAHGRMQDGKWTSGMSMSTVNLVVAGHAIPVNVAPNTAISVAGLGRVVLNRRVRNGTTHANQIEAIRITLSTAKAGLPVGAVIQVSVAATQIS